MRAVPVFVRVCVCAVPFQWYVAGLNSPSAPFRLLDADRAGGDGRVQPRTGVCVRRRRLSRLEDDALDAHTIVVEHDRSRPRQRGERGIRLLCTSIVRL